MVEFPHLREMLFGIDCKATSVVTTKGCSRKRMETAK